MCVYARGRQIEDSREKERENPNRIGARRGQEEEEEKAAEKLLTVFKWTSRRQAIIEFFEKFPHLYFHPYLFICNVFLFQSIYTQWCFTHSNLLLEFMRVRCAASGHNSTHHSLVVGWIQWMLNAQCVSPTRAPPPPPKRIRPCTIINADEQRKRKVHKHMTKWERERKWQCSEINESKRNSTYNIWKRKMLNKNRLSGANGKN